MFVQQWCVPNIYFTLFYVQPWSLENSSKIWEGPRVELLCGFWGRTTQWVPNCTSETLTFSKFASKILSIFSFAQLWGDCDTSEPLLLFVQSGADGQHQSSVRDISGIKFICPVLFVSVLDVMQFSDLPIVALGTWLARRLKGWPTFYSGLCTGG